MKQEKEIGYAHNKVMLYVGGLNYRLDEEAVTKIFSHYGKVLSVHLVLKEEDKKKGIAFVEMKESVHAMKAIRGLNGKKVSGRILRVSVANDRFAAQKPAKKAMAPAEGKASPKSKFPNVEEAPKKKSVSHKGDGRFGLAVLKQYLAQKKTKKA